ncbi:MAG: hypothetical protein AB4368_21845 [Xenococcaceae cyanobacterium]
MREFDNDPAIAQTVELLKSYGLDLHGYTISEIITQLLERYHANWIRLATIEALYLGRYKAVSVEQILRVWARVGTPNPHFSHEFERLICRKLPRNVAYLPENTGDILASSENFTDLIEPITKEPQLSYSDNELPKTPTDANQSLSDNVDATPEPLPKSEQTERSLSKQPSIHQFTPLPDASSFYYKLKSLAEEELKEEE